MEGAPADQRVRVRLWKVNDRSSSLDFTGKYAAFFDGMIPDAFFRVPSFRPSENSFGTKWLSVFGAVMLPKLSNQPPGGRIMRPMSELSAQIDLCRAAKPALSGLRRGPVVLPGGIESAAG